MPSFPYIFTFYSYKGGVGRSLALINVAYALAGRGRHVLVVDMDLEAPGISGFLRRNGEVGEGATPRPQDVLDLLLEAVTAVREGNNPAEIAGRLPPIAGFARPVTPHKLTPLTPRIGEIGRLDFLIADDGRDYWRRLAGLGMQTLTQDRLIALSSALHLYFQSQRFAHRPLGLEPFEPPLQTPYDYVLVDSRTGITEVGGLCVGPLADRLVVLTGLNDQNVQGTLSFLKEAGVEPKARTSGDVPWDTADTVSATADAQPSLGPKPTIFVASPVPPGEMELKHRRLRQLEKLLKIKPLQLSYNPHLGLIECLFVRDYPDEQLSFNYTRLADQVMARVQDHPAQLAQRSSEFWNKEKRPIDAIACALRLAPHQPDLGIPLLMQLDDAFEPRTGAEWLARRRLHAFLSQSSGEMGPLALSNWGIALAAQAGTKSGAEADRLFAAAQDKFAAALRLKPDSHEALYNWGNALAAQANTKSGAQADRLLEGAGEKYAAAVGIKPDCHEALSNWGNALADQARTKSGAEADRLFEGAGEKYAAAVGIKPDCHEALFNWGNALVDQAKTRSGAEADRLFQRAREKLLGAEQIQRGSYAYNLACLEALRGEAAPAVAWLRQLAESGAVLTREALARDLDFARIRNEPVFREFMASLPQ